MNNQFWWHLSRASGIVTWGFLIASALWGILLATRVLKPYDRPAWLLDLHSWLGTITIFGTALHLAALVGDSYVHFGTADLFVPFATSWKPLAVAWGIIAMYLLVVVQVTSWTMKKIPKSLWRTLHMLSYGLFVTVSIHAFSAGTDRANHFFQAVRCRDHHRDGGGDGHSGVVRGQTANPSGHRVWRARRFTNTKRAAAATIARMTIH